MTHTQKPQPLSNEQINNHLDILQAELDDARRDLAFAKRNEKNQPYSFAAKSNTEILQIHIDNLLEESANFVSDYD